MSFTTAHVNFSIMCDLDRFADSPQGGGCHSLLPMLTLPLCVTWTGSLIHPKVGVPFTTAHVNFSIIMIMCDLNRFADSPQGGGCHSLLPILTLPLCVTWTGSLIHPKVVRSVHYCPATKKTMERRYTDMTSLDARPSSAIYPTKVSLRQYDF